MQRILGKSRSILSVDARSWRGVAQASPLARLTLQHQTRTMFTPASEAFPRRTAAELYSEIRELTKPGGDYTVHNYVAVIEDMRPEAVLVETELFPRGAIEFYTAKNMGWDVTEEDYEKWFLEERGGAQGDYREGMQKKSESFGWSKWMESPSVSLLCVIPLPCGSTTPTTTGW